MSSLRLLYELQSFDLEAERVQKQLDQLRQRLGDASSLEPLRRAVQETEERQQQLRAQHRDAEMTSQGLADKRKALEQKLFGGTVRNPRELTGMQEELTYLRKHQQEAEEALLNTMIALEECLGLLDQEKKRLEQAEAKWREEQQRLLEQCGVQERELSRLQAQRQALTPRIDLAQMQTYEQLRKTRGGRAVARVERGMCEVCRIALPMRELQQAQASAASVRCSTCGRLLLVG